MFQLGLLLRIAISLRRKNIFYVFLQLYDILYLAKYSIQIQWWITYKFKGYNAYQKERFKKVLLWDIFHFERNNMSKFDAKYFKAAYLGVILSLKAFYVFEWKKFLKAKSWISRISFFNIRYEIARRYMQRIIIHTRIILDHVILLKC